MNDEKQKMVLAALSQCIADKDKANANISFILQGKFGNSIDNVSMLNRQFEIISQSELTIETIQMYYAKNFPLPQEKIEKKEEPNDNNS